jgi:hypothetical protein
MVMLKHIGPTGEGEGVGKGGVGEGGDDGEHEDELTFEANLHLAPTGTVLDQPWFPLQRP